MNISGVSSYANYFSRTNNVGTNTDSSSSFSSALGAAASDASQASNGGVQKTDFTHMTRKDLADWVNSQIKSGKMSVDESSIFVSMTGHVPVDGAYTGLDDTEQVNFMQSAKDGMVWARQHNDTAILARLQAALGTMEQYQGKISGVDLTA